MRVKVLKPRQMNSRGAESSSTRVAAFTNTYVPFNEQTCALLHLDLDKVICENALHTKEQEYYIFITDLMNTEFPQMF